MTSPKAKAKDYLAGLPDDWQVPDPPPKEPDMVQHRGVSDFDATLMAHFAHRGDVLIGGGGYLRNDPREESEIFAPDCVVAFGVDPQAIVSRNGYVIQHAGKPPDFLLEVASRSTGRRDYTVKREGYAGYGEPESTDGRRESWANWYEGAYKGESLGSIGTDVTRQRVFSSRPGPGKRSMEAGNRRIVRSDAAECTRGPGGREFGGVGSVADSAVRLGVGWLAVGPGREWPAQPRASPGEDAK